MLVAALGVTILGLAALLMSAQPALEPQLVAPPPAHTAPVMDSLAGDLQETLKVQPNTPGRNVALVGIFDTRRPSLGPVTGVDVTTTSADGATLTTVHAVALSDGQWSANLDLERPGATPLSVVALAGSDRRCPAQSGRLPCAGHGPSGGRGSSAAEPRPQEGVSAAADEPFPADCRTRRRRDR